MMLPLSLPFLRVFSTSIAPILSSDTQLKCLANSASVALTTQDDRAGRLGLKIEDGEEYKGTRPCIEDDYAH